ncbi:MAG: porin [Gemmatimonadales bacterium]
MPTRAARTSAALAVLFTLAASPAVVAQQPTYPMFKVSGRLQTQFYYADNKDYQGLAATTSDFFLRRARIQVEGKVTDRVSFVIQPSYENGRSGVRLRDAFLDIRLSPMDAKSTLTFRMGQEKRPFGRYELTSSNNLPSLERGAARGLVPFASNNLFEGNGFLSHDVGASLIFNAPLGDDHPVTLQAGVYNGTGESVQDVNGAKSFGLRGTIAVTRMLNVGASWYSHDGIVVIQGTPDSAFRNTAFGLDAQWGKTGEPGLYLVGDYMDGKDFTAAKNGIRGISVVGAWHVRLANGGWLYAIEPAARFDFADANTDNPDDGATLISGGVNLYLSAKAQLRLMVEHQSFQASGAPSITGVRSAVTVNF